MIRQGHTCRTWRHRSRRSSVSGCCTCLCSGPAKRTRWLHCRRCLGRTGSSRRSHRRSACRHTSVHTRSAQGCTPCRPRTNRNRYRKGCRKSIRRWRRYHGIQPRERTRQLPIARAREDTDRSRHTRRSDTRCRRSNAERTRTCHLHSAATKHNPHGISSPRPQSWWWRRDDYRRQTAQRNYIK
jgi:hypothetical protein